jgi:Phage major tail protein 2.
MAVKSGNKYRIYLTTAGSGSGSGSNDSWIAGEQSNNVDFNNNAIDASDKSTEWDQFISGNKNWTASATFNLDDSASTGQKTLLQSLVSGDKVSIFIGELNNGARSEGHAGDAIITAISQSAERNGIVSRQVTFQGTGAPTMVYPS